MKIGVLFYPLFCNRLAIVSHLSPIVSHRHFFILLILLLIYVLSGSCLNGGKFSGDGDSNSDAATALDTADGPLDIPSPIAKSIDGVDPESLEFDASQVCTSGAGTLSGKLSNCDTNYPADTMIGFIIDAEYVETTASKHCAFKVCYKTDWLDQDVAIVAFEQGGTPTNGGSVSKPVTVRIGSQTLTLKVAVTNVSTLKLSSIAISEAGKIAFSYYTAADEPAIATVSQTNTSDINHLAITPNLFTIKEFVDDTIYAVDSETGELYAISADGTLTNLDTSTDDNGTARSLVRAATTSANHEPPPDANLRSLAISSDGYVATVVVGNVEEEGSSARDSADDSSDTGSTDERSTGSEEGSGTSDSGSDSGDTTTGSERESDSPRRGRIIKNATSDCTEFLIEIIPPNSSESKIHFVMSGTSLCTETTDIASIELAWGDQYLLSSITYADGSGTILSRDTTDYIAGTVTDPAVIANNTFNLKNDNAGTLKNPMPFYNNNLPDNGLSVNAFIYQLGSTEMWMMSADLTLDTFLIELDEDIVRTAMDTTHNRILIETAGSDGRIDHDNKVWLYEIDADTLTLIQEDASYPHFSRRDPNIFGYMNTTNTRAIQVGIKRIE